MTPWMTFKDATLVHALGWSLLHLSWIAALIGFATQRLLRVVPATFSRQRYHTALTAFLVVAMIGPLAVVTMLVSWHRAVFTGSPMQAVAADPTATTHLGWATGQLYAKAEPLLPWLVACWILGALWAVLRLAVAQWRVRRLIASASPLPIEMNERIAALALQMGSPGYVHSRMSDRIMVPTVAGVIAPWILLPRATVHLLGRAQLDTLLIHELAHVGRRDPLINGFQCVVEAFCFFHPSVIQLSRLVRREREFCCDDLVVGIGADVRTYARALANLEALRGRESPLAVAATDGPLVSRVLRLVGPRGRPGRGEQWRAAVAACAAVLALGTSLPVMAASYVDGTTLPPSLRLLAVPIHIDAEDPAGTFTVTLQRHHVVIATMDGVTVPPERLIQRGDSVHFLGPDGSADFAVKLTPRGGISWTARPPRVIPASTGSD